MEMPKRIVNYFAAYEMNLVLTTDYDLFKFVAHSIV